MTGERLTPEPQTSWEHDSLEGGGWIEAAPALDADEVAVSGFDDPWLFPTMPASLARTEALSGAWGHAEPLAADAGPSAIPLVAPAAPAEPDLAIAAPAALAPGPPDAAGTSLAEDAPDGLWPAMDDRPATSWAETASARAHLGAGLGREDDPGARVARRAADGRLARVHLRGGLLTLARASLEQMAGVGALDREALVDLAEARWRSGDLEGAAEAATAHLEAAGDEPLAHLIVAEEADRQGSLVDARRHAAVVRARVGTGLDRLFAGEVRSTAWSMEAADWMDEGATGPGRWGLLAGGREVADPEPRSWRMLPPPSAGSPVARPRVARAAAPAGPSTLDQLELGRTAGAELEAAELELARGAVTDAVDRLALVLRFDPELAPVILSMADRALMAPGDREQGLVALQLLRGDADRVLGLELEAVDAYQESMRALSARATVKESP